LRGNLPGKSISDIPFLDVSLLFSPAVLGWNKSKIGDVVSVVAVCEYIDDPNFVKVRKGDKLLLPLNPLSIFSLPENAKNSDIPQSYLLITNNELVRVRYLLVYGSKKKSTASKPPTSEEVVTPPNRSFLIWCRKNPLIVSFVLYISFLFLVGVSNHRAVEYYKNNLWNFLKKRFKFL
jgi:poly [ADP-ribose] polymerase 16